MKGAIAHYLAMSLSFDDMARLYNYGRLSPEVWQSWQRVWEWLSPKMGGAPGLRHDIYWNRYGKDRYFAKINKTRVAFGFEPIKF